MIGWLLFGCCWSQHRRGHWCQEWQNNAGTVLASVNIYGGVTGAYLNVGDSNNGVASNGSYALRFNGTLVNVGSASPSGAQLTVTNPTATNIGLIVKGAASQSANLQEWQNSAGTVLAKVDANGNITAANYTMDPITAVLLFGGM